ncbi:hypothetical protein M0534_08900 [Methylonatrum kenyense]|uniref:hypothetical protein n=1 Tax=Methylonatrum kenyense TaxID=455253 RepID=UPI0020BDCB03|nr:hypothetical protein [Methylonatrum kenyense]MCK8516441.1 hypothetical protein [Methylonatrum kenyense]
MMRALVAGVGLLLATTLPALDEFEDDPELVDTGADTDAGARGYYVFAGAGVQSFEGWNSGTLGSLVLGRKFNYTPVDSPRSSLALELELSRSIDPVTRTRGGERRERNVTTVGGWLALNTYVTENAFHRVRLGAVYRYLDRDPGSGSSQARIGFGLGLGYALTEQVEAVADATLHYMGTQELMYGAVGGLRLNF